MLYFTQISIEIVIYFSHSNNEVWEGNQTVINFVETYDQVRILLSQEDSLRNSYTELA